MVQRRGLASNETPENILPLFHAYRRKVAEYRCVQPFHKSGIFLCRNIF